jgi:hypothetical protein
MPALFLPSPLVSDYKDVFFVILFLSVPASNLFGWVEFAETRPGFNSPKTHITMMGLAANAAAFLLPWFRGARIIPACFALSAIAMAISFVGIRRLRFILLFGSLGAATLWLIIPIAVL